MKLAILVATCVLAAGAQFASPRQGQIGNSEATVPASGYTAVPFTVPPGTLGWVCGNFSSTGGFGSTIQVAVLDEDMFRAFKNGRGAGGYYLSGEVGEGILDVGPLQPGTFYLVFNNRFSLLTPKVIYDQIALSGEPCPQTNGVG